MAPRRLTEQEIERALAGLPEGWSREGETLEKTFRCGDFRGSIAFVQRVADAAEAMNHHPDIWIRFQRVRLTLTTHSAGGITENDIELARRIEAVAPTA